MVWLRRGGKKDEPAAAGKGPEDVYPWGQPRDNGASNGRIDIMQSDENATEDGLNNGQKIRSQFMIKIELTITQNLKVFNCAAIRKEWFTILKKKDPSARIITYKEAVVTK